MDKTKDKSNIYSSSSTYSEIDNTNKEGKKRKKTSLATATHFLIFVFFFSKLKINNKSKRKENWNSYVLNGRYLIFILYACCFVYCVTTSKKEKEKKIKELKNRKNVEYRLVMCA
jgi:preprotein translocase subunit SecG